MKSKTAIKAGLDLIMTLVFALLFNKMVLGLTFHEAAGLAIGFAILIHLVLNYKWIVQITKRFFSKELPLRIRLGYVLNILLFLSFIAIIVSGIFISKVFLVSVRGFGTLNYKIIHTGASKLALVLIGVHIGLHWSFIKHILMKVFGKVNVKVRKVLALVAVLTLIIGGGYSFWSAGIISHIGGGMEGGHEMGARGEKPSFDGQVTSDDGQVSFPDQSERDSSEFSGKERGGELGMTSISITNVFSVIAKYVSIMGFVATITAILDQMIIRNKRKRLILSPNI